MTIISLDYQSLPWLLNKTWAILKTSVSISYLGFSNGLTSESSVEPSVTDHISFLEFNLM